jgi:hypothetical protein
VGFEAHVEDECERVGGVCRAFLDEDLQLFLFLPTHHHELLLHLKNVAVVHVHAHHLMPGQGMTDVELKRDPKSIENSVGFRGHQYRGLTSQL